MSARVPGGPAGLRVEGAAVSYGELRALDGVDLVVSPGEVCALVGPSGCGKSTLLRLIAGLEHGTGTVAWGSEDLTRTRPDRRRFGLMFQDHALFPGRSVADNIAFGLRASRVPRSARVERVAEMLDLVGLAGYGARGVDTLSGGEAQRVALARALAPSPRLLMLDEPLGSLDRELRERLSAELRRILTTAGVAAVHVTHDQEEAYAVADRLVVMRRGRILRDGPAATVWSDPRTVFVARFLGHRNIVDRTGLAALGLDDVLPGADRVTIREAAMSLADPTTPSTARPSSTPPTAGRAAPAAARLNRAVVAGVRFHGSISRVELRVGAVTLYLHTSRPPTVGDAVGLRIDPEELAPLTDDGSAPM